MPSKAAFGPGFAKEGAFDSGRESEPKLTGSRWPWERWYSEPVGFFMSIGSPYLHAMHSEPEMPLCCFSFPCLHDDFDSLPLKLPDGSL